MRTNRLCARKLLITGLASLASTLCVPRLPAQSVLTWHNDAARTGQNLTETLLSPSNVNSTSFGLKFTLPVDGKVDAQPLYVPSVSISGVTHNVVYVATENDTVYAFDADAGGSPLWSHSVLLSGETASDDRGCGNVTPVIGIVATPAIDLASGPNGTIYLVAMSKDGSGNYYQRLHALDITTGNEQPGWPVTVQATYPGNGSNSSGGMLTFDPGQYMDRAALLISKGVIYTAWGSHCDHDPYNGWLIGYNESTRAQVVLSTTPNGTRGGIWMAGGGPAADAAGNLYLLVGNGSFDTALNGSGFPSQGDYGNAFMKFSTASGLAVADYFTMDNTVSESNGDEDLGSAGGMLLPVLNDAMGHPHSLAVGAGKDGTAYVVDRGNMGKFNMNSNAVYQEFPLSPGHNQVYSSPAWFDNALYYGAIGSPLSAFSYSGGSFDTSSPSSTSHSFGVNCDNTGATPSISANGSAFGIVWAMDTPCDNTQAHQAAVLYAFDPSTLTELYDSTQNTSENFGAGVTFPTPTVANGKVYVGTQTSVAVFGLLNCTYSTTQNATSSNTFTVTVNTGALCSWSAASTASFITITGGASGTGSGMVSFQLPPYSGPARTGSVVVAGQRFTITQRGSITSVVTPNSGSGTSQTFTLQYSDTAGASTLQQVWVYFNATLANPASNACLLYYNAATNQINLLGDNGTTWQGATLGSANTLQNSQCSVSAASSSVALGGNTLTWNVALTFKAAYAGAKNIYMLANDASGSSSGWLAQGSWTVPSPTGTPAAVSVTPSAGSGTSQTFALQYSDTSGSASLQQVWVYFNATLANPASNACLLYYNAPTNQISLLGDSGSTWQAVTLGSATTLQNSQCSLNAATSTVTGSGNTFTWNVAMTFKPAYAGAKNIYMRAIDLSGSTSGWQQRGSWTVTSGAGGPATVSVTPSSGSGANQTFALQYSDTAGAASLQQVWVYFNATLANPASNACLLYYNAPTNQISLLGDSGSTWQAATLGSATTLQNSQCSLNAATSTVAGSGNTFTWNVAMTFKPAYAGAKNVYMRAIDVSSASSGWQQLGSWTVTVGTGTPSTVSVTPSSGSGSTQTFALQYSDTAGAASLQQVWVYFNATLANPASNACLLYFNAPTNRISLLGDNGTTWQAATLGSANTLQNSQCSVNAQTSTVTGSGNTLTWNVPMTFMPAYAGAKNTYLHAVDVSGSNSGWQSLGSWTAP